MNRRTIFIGWTIVSMPMFACAYVLGWRSVVLAIVANVIGYLQGRQETQAERESR